MLFTSPYHALRFPEHVSVPEFVLRHTSDEVDDKPLLYLSPHTDRTEAKSISLGEIRTQSRAFATALLSQSKGPWKKGDVVFFYSENQHDYLLVVLGVMLAGGIPALVNPQCRGDELKNALNLVSPKILIASKATLPKAKDSVREWQRTVGRKVDVYVFDETHEQSYHHLVHLGRELEHQGNRMVDDVHINPVHDPAMYCFSSGTSGRPKAVVLSHHNLVANTIQMTVALGGRVNKPLFDEGWYDQPHAPLQVGKDQFHYSILPQFHCYGMITSLINLHTATPSVIMPRFYPEQFFEVVQKFRVTFAFVVPPILLALAQSHLVNKYDISSIRSFASGAAYLSKELCKMVHEMHGIQVTDGYGLTEFSPIVSLQTEKDLETKQLNVGRLVPNTEAKVMCLETKQPLSAGERGELWVRGPQMMLGYLHNDEANASAFDPNPTDPERFFKTGDIASIDEQGFVRLHDRFKDIIKYNGYQVAASTLEEEVTKLPFVFDVAVVGKIHDHVTQNELPWAVVVCKSEAADRPEQQRTQELLDFVNARVAGYKKLRGVTWVDKLPRSYVLREKTLLTQDGWQSTET